MEPGGIFLNVEHVSSPSEWITSVNDELFVDYLHRFHRDKSRSEVAATYYHRPDKSANILAPVESQCQWLREIGLHDVDCFLKNLRTRRIRRTQAVTGYSRFPAAS